MGDASPAPRAGTGTGSTEYRFTGQQDDAALGYQYLRARYYDPATGRFISRDPFPGSLSNPSSQHRYVYAQNNPTDVTDPSGETPWALIGAGIGFIGGAGLYAATHWDQVSQGEVDWGEAGRYAVGGALLLSGVGAVAQIAGVGTATVSAAPVAAAVGRIPQAVQAFRSFDSFKAAMGPAGSGQAWHHIVEQCQESRFGAEMIHNSANVVRVASSVNLRLNAIYSSIRPDITGSTSLTVRQWLSGLSYDVQYEFGLKALRHVESGVW